MGKSASYDKKDLEYIGEGKQGVVYRIDKSKCIKYHKQSKAHKRELSALKKANGEPIFPVLYDYGKNYIVREYIAGTSLREYLRINKLTPSICKQLLEIIQTFKKLRFKRLDIRLAHIFITPSGMLRIIDPTNAMNINSSYPRRLLRGLNSRRMKEQFLGYVRQMDEKLAASWEKEYNRNYSKV